MPGYGFSGKPTEPGWDPVRIARAWTTLMQRLGYTQFVAQGGDWGDAITELMALQAPPELLGIHTNMPATVPAEIAKALKFGEPPPAGLSADEKHAWDQLDFFYKKGLGYALEMANRPQTLYAIADSPIGLAAWILDHDARSYELIARVFDGKNEGLTRDDVLDNITLYWLTNTAVSSARLYWENKLAFFDVKDVAIPVAVSVFPDEIYAAPRSWAERAYPEADPLQQAQEGRPLRGLGAAAAVHGGAAGSVQIAALAMREAIDHRRRSFVGNAAAALAATQLGLIPAVAQSGGAGPKALPAIKPGTNTSFASLKQIDAGVLNVGYAEAGPANGSPVILLHGWPYDIHSYVDVAPLLASAGYRVIVPYLRGYGTTRFLSGDTPRNGQQAVIAVDNIALMDALKIERAIVAGCDWGARTADIMAALWPERCKALVSVSGYLIGSREANKMPLPPKAEFEWWYQYYFATERGRAGYEKYRREFARLIWQLASPQVGLR